MTRHRIQEVACRRGHMASLMGYEMTSEIIVPGTRYCGESQMPTVNNCMYMTPKAIAMSITTIPSVACHCHHPTAP